MNLNDNYNNNLNTYENKHCTILRDVMNTKSDKHFRHSVDANNIKTISWYYAIESRIFNAVYDSNLNKYIRGDYWFTNIMVFDFDYDEEHFPNIKDYHKELDKSLNKLYSILGKPKYILTNKNNYTKEQDETYFTKKGVVKRPKKYGCQVVYELKDSLQSQYKEKVKLYNTVRNKISAICNADLNFKGHMFKNFYNKNLFNVIENEKGNYDLIDIKDIAINKLKMNKNLIESIYNLKPFETLKDKESLPNYNEAVSKNKKTSIFESG